MKRITLILLIVLSLTSCASGIRINGVEVRANQTRKIKPGEVVIGVAAVFAGIHLGRTNNLSKLKSINP